jgi:hypothetical protein
MRSLIMTLPDKDGFVESWVGVGVEQGIEQGRTAGLAEAKASDILKIMDARNLKTSEEQREQVMASTDLGRLDLWFDRALTADSAEEVFRS